MVIAVIVVLALVVSVASVDLAVNGEKFPQVDSLELVDIAGTAELVVSVLAGLVAKAGLVDSREPVVLVALVANLV